MEIPTGEFYFRLGVPFSRDLELSEFLNDFLNVDISLQDQQEYSNRNIRMLRDSRAASKKIFLDRVNCLEKMKRIILLRR